MSALDTLLGRPSPTPVPDVSISPPPLGAPRRAALVGELRSAHEIGRLLRASTWLALAPRGHGQVVIDLPGWRAPEVSGAPIRAYLRLLGYETRSWGLGRNRGTPERDVDRLVERLSQRSGDQPVSLVGWSLGGLIAREVAREIPDRVERVITYGSPIVGGPTHTVAATSYGEEECQRAERFLRHRAADRPLAVPVTAIYTKRDAIVDWRACIDHISPDVEHVEVRSTHLGLGLDPDVWWAVATSLARLPRRYSPTSAHKPASRDDHDGDGRR